MKRWPIIRHVRCFAFLMKMSWKAVMVWNAETGDVHRLFGKGGLFHKETEHAIAMWVGKE